MTDPVFRNAPLVAAIDIGTNSFHMVIASADSRGRLTVHHKHKIPVRLGKGPGNIDELQPDAIRRGIEALKVFSEKARESGAIVRAMATSAVREAANRDEFITPAKQEAGIDVNVISGGEEARLIYEGVRRALPVQNTRTLIIDIGGGSTECIVGEKGRTIFANSTKIGAVRLANEFFPEGVSNAGNVKNCREFISGIWKNVLEQVKSAGFRVSIGTSGTITSLVKMVYAEKGIDLSEKNVLEGLYANREDLLRVTNRVITTETVNDRIKIPGMEEKRVDILPAGALIIDYAIKFLQVEKIIISPYALREGILFDYYSNRFNL
jgi:exopolyphosphatase/guanosine-5'-triphosphate,3'-diphosphate pyrophosphatase